LSKARFWRIVARDKERRSMHTKKSRPLIQAGCAIVALVALGVLVCPPSEAATARREASGAIRFYDDNGYDRGYAWCLRRAHRNESGGNDCSYYTYEQCRAAVYPPGGDCTPHPWAAYVQPPPTNRSRR
jgi:hypothetical protein